MGVYLQRREGRRTEIFLLAERSDAFNLGAVSLRLGGRRLLFDATNMKNHQCARSEQVSGREYRPGWELTGV